jgi:hypothetical protein
MNLSSDMYDFTAFPQREKQKEKEEKAKLESQSKKEYDSDLTEFDTVSDVESDPLIKDVEHLLLAVSSQ